MTRNPVDTYFNVFAKWRTETAAPVMHDLHAALSSTLPTSPADAAFRAALLGHPAMRRLRASGQAK